MIPKNFHVFPDSITKDFVMNCIMIEKQCEKLNALKQILGLAPYDVANKWRLRYFFDHSKDTIP